MLKSHRPHARAGEASVLEQQLADSLHAMEQLQQVTNLLLQGGLQDCIVRVRRWHGRLAEQQQEAQVTNLLLQGALQDCIVRVRRWHGRLAEQQQEAQDLKAGLAAAQGEVRALQAALAALAAQQAL
ncbi:hypothetical protein HaLaN_25830 [Haematococcus lacustris]|uniref:Uncharacterized protein n=1 Tax=Haematococcus lacustris TaxID=44745 RepID=A0A6A0A0P9_HAELA|nr:hypothetical protein HaLaN_25830 [Haematococcus lacustris]